MIVPKWHWNNWFWVTLVRLFPSQTGTIFPKLHRHNCSKVTLAPFFSSGSGATAPNCFQETLAQLFLSETLKCRHFSWKKNAKKKYFPDLQLSAFLLGKQFGWFWIDNYLWHFVLEYVHMRGEMNSNRYEISFRLKISLRCSVSSLLVFRWIEAKWLELKAVWISYRSFWPKWNFKPAWDFHVNIIYPKRNK